MCEKKNPGKRDGSDVGGRGVKKERRGEERLI
jgi:hypothetical protein